MKETPIIRSKFGAKVKINIIPKYVENSEEKLEFIITIGTDKGSIFLLGAYS